MLHKKDQLGNARLLALWCVEIAMPFFVGAWHKNIFKKLAALSQTQILSALVQTCKFLYWVKPHYLSNFEQNLKHLEMVLQTFVAGSTTLSEQT